MIQKDTMYIVSSSQKNTIKKILSEKLDLLYGNFEIIEIAGFDNKTASNFLREKLQGVTIPQVYIDYLINFTEGNPFYLETISKKIADIAGSRTLAFVDQMIIIETFTALLFNSSGAINQYFTNIIMSLMEKGVRKTYLEILTALASGANKLKDLAKWFDKKSHANFAKILEKLIEEDVIYKNGIFYELQDKVFEFWLKSVYNERKNLLVDEATTRTDNFRNMLKTDIDGYLAESQKTALERIKDLFLLFNGETVEIEKKHRRLPRFVKIEAGKYAKSEELVNCQESDKCWVCDVWKEKIDETAISDFIERSLPLKDKIAKKICIALGGIDGNAVLLAKEKNIWVWNLENLNNLFRLYKRHRLIHT